jgi:hypothetical protein
MVDKGILDKLDRPMTKSGAKMKDNLTRITVYIPTQSSGSDLPHAVQQMMPNA